MRSFHMICLNASKCIDLESGAIASEIRYSLFWIYCYLRHPQVLSISSQNANKASSESEHQTGLYEMSLIWLEELT